MKNDSLKGIIELADSPEGLFELFTNLVNEYFNADNTFIYFRFEGYYSLVYSLEDQKKDEVAARNIYINKDSILKSFDKNPKTIIIDNSQKSLFKYSSLLKRGYLSTLVQPIIYKDVMVGILVLMHQDSHYFRGFDVSFLENTLSIYSQDLNKSRIVWQANKRLESLQIIESLVKEINDLKAIQNKKDRTRFQQNKLTDTIKSSLRKIGYIVNAQSGFVALAKFKDNYAEKSENLSFGLGDKIIPDLEIPIIEKTGSTVTYNFKREKNITGLVIASGKEYYCPDTKDDPYYKQFEYSNAESDHLNDDDTRSEIAIPLRFQNETFGAILLDSIYLNAFSKDDIDILLSISISIALLIKRFSYLNKLLDLSESYKSIDNLNKLYTEICQETVNTLDTKVVFLRILEKDNLIIKESTGIKLNEKIQLHYKEGISGMVAETKKLMNVENVQQDQRYKYKEFAIKNDLFAMLSAPIISLEKYGKQEKQDVLGVLTIYANRICKFTSLDEQLLYLIADKAGKALKKSILIQQLKEISEIDKELTTTSELHTLKKIADIAKNLLEADSVVLFQYHQNQKNGRGLRAHSIMSGEFISDELKISSEKKIGNFIKAILNKKTNEFYIDWNSNNDLITALYKNQLNINIDNRFYRRENLTSTIILKLIYKGEIVGILFINYRYKKSISSDEKRIAHVFGNKAAVAISNIRKYDDINSLHKIGHALVGTTKLKNLLTKIAEFSLKTLKADVISLYEWNNVLQKPNYPPIIAGYLYNERKMKGEPQEDDIQFKIAKAGTNIYRKDVRRSSLFLGNKIVAPERVGKRFIDREKIISSAGCLLKVHGDIVGLMFVNYRNKQRFGDNEKRIIEIFANQAAIAIRNAKMFGELQNLNKRRLVGLTAIEKSGYQIIRSLDKQNITEKDILQPIMDQVLNLIGVDLGYISMFIKKQQKCRVSNFSPIYERLQNALLNIDYSQQEWIKQEKKYDIFNHRVQGEYKKFSDHPELIENGLCFFEDKDVKSALRVPIYDEHHILGMIVLESEKDEFFTKDDAHTIVSLANQASIAIKNYRLINQLKKLQEIDQAILREAYDLEQVLEIILRSALELVKKDFAEISLLNDQNELKPTKWYPRDLDLSMETLKIDKSVSGYAILNNTSYYIKDVTEQSLFVKTEHVFTQSELVIPLLEDKKPIGVFNIESEILDAFTKEDIRILKMLAGQASIAIHLAKQKERLIEKEKVANLGYITRESVHWIGNKIGPIKRRTEALKEGLTEMHNNNIDNRPLIKKLLEDVEIIEEASKSALSIRSNLIDRPSGANYITFNVIDTLNAVIEHFNNNYNRIKPESSDDLLTYSCKFTFKSKVKKYLIKWEEPFLHRMFYYILCNSYQAVEDKINFLNVENDYSGDIQASLISKDKRILISISDNGIGIDEDNKNKIFNPFFTTKSAARGSGVGLSFCERMMKELNGQIFIAETSYGKGTTINLIFPFY
jgi:GAF domain-containing protein